MDLVVGAEGGGGLEDLIGGRREVSRSAAEQLAKRFQMAYFECSAVCCNSISFYWWKSLLLV